MYLRFGKLVFVILILAFSSSFSEVMVAPMEGFLMSTTSWNAGTLTVSTMRTMNEGERCVLFNNDTVEIDFGLRCDGDSLLSPSYIPNYNHFVLRAYFNNNPSPPIEFHPGRDFVKSSLTWATDLIFGPGGYDVPPGDSVNLWLQLLTPILTSECGRWYTITLEIRYKLSTVTAEDITQNFYIHFYLLCTAMSPDTTYGSDFSCDADREFYRICVDPVAGTMSWYCVYRDIEPVFWATSLYDSLIIGTIGSWDSSFTDYFTDELWIPYASKGLCDCNINYFWSVTERDTIYGVINESGPGNPVGEFDFCLESPEDLTHQNHIVYTLVRSEISEAASPNADDLLATIGGSTTLKRWNAYGQVWEVIAFWSTFPDPGYVGSADVQLLHPYVVDGGVLDPVWSMQIPGTVPPDPHFDLIHNDSLTSWNHISLPFMEQQIVYIQTACDLYDEIPGTESIREWNAAGQVWNVIAFWSAFPPPGGCVGSNPVRAGYPYMVSVSGSLEWPPVPARLMR